MNNNLQIDLKNEVQFPALKHLAQIAFSSMPTEFDYYDYTLPKTMANNDFNTIAQKVKKYVPHFVQSMRLIFEGIIEERDCYLAINIQDKNQRDCNVLAYNKMAVKQVDNIIELQYFAIEFVCKLNEEQKQELNIKQYFNEWYKQLPIEDETGTNEAPQAAGTNANKKIQWLGNASHLGYIIYQLANNGFIEYPIHNGEVNYTGLAERLLNAFEFKDKTPAKKYLSEQINPESENNKISDTNKQKLKLNIPNLQDLS